MGWPAEEGQEVKKGRMIQSLKSNREKELAASVVTECAPSSVTGAGKNQKEEGGFMKKLFFMLLAASVVGLFASTVKAADWDNAYVVVRCTVNVSVDVAPTGTDNAWVPYINDAPGTGPYNGGVNQIYVSTGVAVRNTSSGAITNWTLHLVSTQTYSATPDIADFANTTTAYPDWTYGNNLTANGPNKIVIAAVFKSNPAVLGDYNDLDVLFSTGTVYKTGSADLGPAADEYFGAVASGNNLNMVAPTDTRNLYFRVLTPSAVTDSMYRKFEVLVKAGLGL